jgi:glycosyltransferase involved in cell wall biosynthesis
MPVYNGARFVSRAIESVLQQTYRDVELVIVNDGSPDDSADVIRPYLADPRIKYVEQANAGVAAARNRALREASGEFVGLIDQDDVWLPDKVARQVQLLAAHPDVALVHCSALPIDDDDRLLAAHTWHAGDAPRSGYADIFMGNPIRACTALFRRDAAVAAGGFDPDPAINFADEYDLWLRIARWSDIVYDATPLAHYRVHDSNNSADKAMMVRATLAVLRKALRTQAEAAQRVGAASIRERFARLHLTLYRARTRQHRRAAALAEWMCAFWTAPRMALWLSLSATEKARVLWYRKRLLDLVTKP